jgi:hypothetical protein
MLKKIIITLALVAFAANAFASTTLVLSGGTSWPTTIAFVPSKSVTLGYETSAGGAGGTNSVYTIGSKNTAGDKIFATTSASTAIVWKAGNAGTALAAGDGTTIPSTVSDSRIDTGWSVL